MEKVVNEAHRSKFQTLEQFYTPEDLLVFDIETTGFTAEHTALYLIGCAYYKNRQWNICQWFRLIGWKIHSPIWKALIFISRSVF